MKQRVLLLEDDVQLVRALAREFEEIGFLPSTAGSISKIPQAEFEYAVVDLRLAGELGLDAVDRIKRNSPQCRIVVLTGYGSISTAVEALKRGAVDYLTKPASFHSILSALQGRRVAQFDSLKPRSLAQNEGEYIDYVLLQNNGNVTKTAKDLGLHRQSLQRKLKKYT